MRPFFRFAFLALTLSVPAAGNAQQPASACGALKSLHLEDTKILKADQYAAGAFPISELPAAMAPAVPLIPAVCRVSAELTPTPDSHIMVELWLPAEHWNGKFRGQGNGGFAGEINHWLIALSVFNGYASAGTDAGHTTASTGASWAIGHREKIADFGYRAIHLMTLRSQDLIKAYYGAAAKRSYFSACSDGGREALMEAQRYPADYDGILAGAPAYNWTGLVTNGLNNVKALEATPESYIPAAKLPAINSAVLAACDKLDGLADGILTDPRACHFDPAVLLCKAADSNACLTAPQVKSLATIYTGSRKQDGKQLFPGFAPGGEADAGGWADWITGSAQGKSITDYFVTGYFGDMVFPPADGKPSIFNAKTISLDDAYAAAMRTTAANLNATDPNLAPFFARGGKLILYHGWSDPAIPPLATIDYYNNVVATVGPKPASDALRLYLAPGMGHCTGGPGPDNFGQFGWVFTQGPDDIKRDVSLALEQWVETGTAPEEIIATKYKGDSRPENEKMTRPLCPYPQTAKYKGTGDPNQAASFSCVAPAKLP